MNKYASENKKGAGSKNVDIIVTDESQPSLSTPKKKLEKTRLMATLENLRDNAIHNICRYNSNTPDSTHLIDQGWLNR